MYLCEIVYLGGGDTYPALQLTQVSNIKACNKHEQLHTHSILATTE